MHGMVQTTRQFFKSYHTRALPTMQRFQRIYPVLNQKSIFHILEILFNIQYCARSLQPLTLVARCTRIVDALVKLWR